MASIRKEIPLAASPEAVWDVVRDIGAVATRFAPGFVVDVQMEPGARLVTFGNGMVARETIVDLDEAARRLVYSVASERLTHHNASFQVVADGAGSRLIWVADLLPEAAAATVDAMMEQGAAATKRALDGLSA
jgi:carbon monoxide dehydrogenase subunit G